MWRIRRNISHKQAFHSEPIFWNSVLTCNCYTRILKIVIYLFHPARMPQQLYSTTPHLTSVTKPHQPWEADLSNRALMAERVKAWKGEVMEEAIPMSKCRWQYMGTAMSPTRNLWLVGYQLNGKSRGQGFGSWMWQGQGIFFGSSESTLVQTPLWLHSMHEMKTIHMLKITLEKASCADSTLTTQYAWYEGYTHVEDPMSTLQLEKASCADSTLTTQYAWYEGYTHVEDPMSTLQLEKASCADSTLTTQYARYEGHTYLEDPMSTFPLEKA